MPHTIGFLAGMSPFVKEHQMRVSKAADTDIEQVGTMREGKLGRKAPAVRRRWLAEQLRPEPGSHRRRWLAAPPAIGTIFDQIRYVIQGQLPYTEEDVLEEGWVGVLPRRAVHDGSQKRRRRSTTMVLQSGCASGAGYLSVAQREATNAELNKTGEFKKGKYHYTDADGVPQTLDGSQAIFEHAMGHQLEFATPRYTDVIAMNPEAYDWLPQGDAGIWEKWLGSFTERHLRIGFLRLDAGAVYQSGPTPLHRNLVPDQRPGVRGRREEWSRNRIPIPGQRRPSARRGHRTHRIPPHRTASF